MKKNTFYLAVLVFCVVSVLPVPVCAQVAMPEIIDSGPLDWSPVLSQIDADFGSVQLSGKGLESLLELGRRRAWNVFQLLAEAGSEFRSRGLRVSVSGDDLRKAVLVYRLGDSRVDAILPIQKFKSLEIGATSGSGQNEIVIRLTGKHSDYLELGNFYLEEEYGFKTISTKKLDASFGARVKKGPFNFNLSRIEMIESPHNDGNPNYIAIVLSGFPRAKRWHIDPIRFVSKTGA